MSKTPSKSLFYLIQSLTRTEKRYISLSLSKEAKGQKNIHLSLFEQINKQKEYNEEKLIKLKELDYGKNLTSRKSYLFNLILKKLDAYQFDNQNNENVISRHIRHAKILLTKSLIKDAMNILEKADKLANEQEELHLLARVLQLKKRGVKYLYPSFADYYTHRAEIYQEEGRVLEKIANLHHYTDSLNKFQLIITKTGGSALTETEKKELEAIRFDASYDSENNALTNKAKIQYHNLLALYAFWILKDTEVAYQHYARVFVLIDRIPNYIESEIYDYMFFVSKYIYYGHILGKGDEVKEAFEQLKDLFENSPFEHYPAINAELFRYYVNVEIVKMYWEKSYHRIFDLAPVVEEGIKKYDVHLLMDEETILVMYSNVGMMFLISGDYKTAFKWLIGLMDPKLKTREDIKHESRVQVLLCLYEMDEISLFDSHYRSFMRHYKSRKGDFSFEIKLLELLKQLFQAKFDDDRVLKAKRLAKHMADRVLDEENKPKFDLILPILWVTGNIKDLTLLHCITKLDQHKLLKELAAFEV